MKIVVVLAGQRPGGGIEAENFTRQPRGFGCGDGLGHARFGNHALNLIRKGSGASIFAGSGARNSTVRLRRASELRMRARQTGEKPVLFARRLYRNRPVYGRKTDHRWRAAKFDAAIVVVPCFPRVVAYAGLAI